MIRSESSVEIAKPVSQVFAFVEDHSKTPEWLESCVELRQTSSGPKQAGAAMHYVYREGRGKKEMDGTITAYVKDRQLTMKFVDSKFGVQIEFLLSPASQGTLVTHSIAIDVKGFFGRLMSGMIEAGNKRHVVNNLSRLKLLLEKSV